MFILVICIQVVCTYVATYIEFKKNLRFILFSIRQGIAIIIMTIIISVAIPAMVTPIINALISPLSSAVNSVRKSCNKYTIN